MPVEITEDTRRWLEVMGSFAIEAQALTMQSPVSAFDRALENWEQGGLRIAALVQPEIQLAARAYVADHLQIISRLKIHKLRNEPGFFRRWRSELLVAARLLAIVLEKVAREAGRGVAGIAGEFVGGLASRPLGGFFLLVLLALGAFLAFPSLLKRLRISG